MLSEEAVSHPTIRNWKGIDRSWNLMCQSTCLCAKKDNCHRDYQWGNYVLCHSLLFRQWDEWQGQTQPYFSHHCSTTPRRFTTQIVFQTISQIFPFITPHNSPRHGDTRLLSDETPISVTQTYFSTLSWKIPLVLCILSWQHKILYS